MMEKVESNINVQIKKFEVEQQRFKLFGENGKYNAGGTASFKLTCSSATSIAFCWSVVLFAVIFLTL